MKHFVKTKRFGLNQTKEQAFNTDTILLANYIKVPKGAKNILDVGTGSAFLMLDLAFKTNANIYGIEIQENRFLQAKENIDLNGLKERLTVYNNDFKNQNFDYLFDLVVTNPPFFKVVDKDRLSKDEEDMIARHEVNLTLEELINNVSRVLKYRGYFYMIHRPERIDEIFLLCEKYNLKVKRIRFVHPYANKEANHVLVMAIKNGGDGIIIDKPLILYKDKHIFTSEMEEIIGDF